MRLLHDFYTWVLSLRRSGTSSLLERIAKTEDVYVLVPTADEKKDKKWKGKALCFEDLKRTGLKPKPILIDNHFMIELADRAYKYQLELESKVQVRNSLLYQIKANLLQFEKRNGNFDGSPNYDFDNLTIH